MKHLMAGWVQHVVGGAAYGLIFQRQSIIRMTYAGALVQLT